MPQSVPLDEVAKNVVSEAKEGGGKPEKKAQPKGTLFGLALPNIVAMYRFSIAFCPS